MQHKPTLLIFLILAFSSQNYGFLSSLKVKRKAFLDFIKTALPQHEDLAMRYSLTQERFENTINKGTADPKLRQDLGKNLNAIAEDLANYQYLQITQFGDLHRILRPFGFYAVKAPATLQLDIQEIASRLNYDNNANIELCNPIPSFYDRAQNKERFGCALLPRSTIILSSWLYDNSSRRRLLCLAGHEIAHLKYHQNKRLLSQCALKFNFIDKSDYFEISQDIEREADFRPILALGNGHDLANYFFSLYEEKKPLSKQHLHHSDHPHLLDRAKGCMTLHNAFIYDMKYLKSRLWKIGWIIRSWATHEDINEYEESISFANQAKQQKFHSLVCKILNTFPEWKFYLSYDFELWNEGLQKISNAELNYLWKEILSCAQIYRKIKLKEQLIK